MAKYKGKYKGTIKAKDVGKQFTWVGRFRLPVGIGWGKVMPADVGKQIWVCKRQYYIENEEQMLGRLSDLNSATASV